MMNKRLCFSDWRHYDDMSEYWILSDLGKQTIAILKKTNNGYVLLGLQGTIKEWPVIEPDDDIKKVKQTVETFLFERGFTYLKPKLVLMG